MSTVLTLNGDVVTSNGSVVKVDINGAQSSKSYTVSGSGNTTISPDTGYTSMESVALTVPSGSATGPSSISESSATVSTGTNTLTLTKTGVSTTPTVSAGYVSSATSSTATVALTASVTTKGATTYYPSTSDQTIASGTYTTGTQTFKAVTVSDTLVASNIKDGVTIEIGDSTDSDRITSVTGTYAGGSGIQEAEEKDVIFIDYDGTIVYSYTAAEFAQLTELPANPTHEGLTAQGWNWTLSDAKTYVSTYGRHCIGQNYVTDDGKTRIYISVDSTNLDPYFSICVKGTATVDYGDNSTPSTFTGNGARVAEQHTYAAPGNYIIKVTPSSGSYIRIGGSGISGDENQGCFLIWASSSASYKNTLYQKMIYKIELGERVYLEDYAFTNLRELKQISIPTTFNLSYDGTTRIIYVTSEAFKNCAITGCVIPGGVGISAVGDSSYESCTSMRYISLPKSVNTFNTSSSPKSPFYNCTSLKLIAIPPNTTSFPVYLFNLCYCLNTVGPMPSGTTIPDSFFNSNYSRVSINIPSGISTLGDRAFSKCYAVSSITLPDTVTTIGEYCFSECKSLTSINTNKVTVINSHAFRDSGLTSITLGSSLTSISGYVFRECVDLTSITIPSSVTTFGTAGYQFWGCTYLTSATFNNSITTIPTYCFYGCSRLTSIQFPTGCTTISAYAFTQTGFTSITIPATVTTIGTQAFYKCTSMQEIHFLPTTPPTVTSSTFTNLPTTCVIYVPSASLSTYKSASNYPNSNTYTYVGE